MNALLIIDVQNDFCPGGALPVREGDRIVPLLNRLQPAFELVVATQDWHPADHESFAANHPGKQPGDTIDLGGMPQILWPVHCVQSTPGADFVPGLDRSRIARVFRKGIDRHIDSYSGFFDNGHLRTTGLEEFLRQQGVKTVSVAGLATDYCVLFTALDAVGLGFPTRVVIDACRGVELRAGDLESAIERMRRAGVEIVQSDALKPI